MESYESYKTIDLPWIKSIPAHWEIKKNKNVLKACFCIMSHKQIEEAV